MKKIKVAIAYRVMQSWRVPVFERLAKIPDIDLKVFYGEDFEGTKVVSYKKDVNFSTAKIEGKNLKLKTSNGYAYIPMNLGLYRELKSFKPDVIITEGASNVFNNLLCFLYAKRRKVKVIQWGLGEIKGRKKSLQRKIIDVFFRYIERHSDAAIAYSSFGASYYEKVGVPAEKVFVAVNVVDTETRRREYLSYVNMNSPVSTCKTKLRVLFVGALSVNKKVDLLIKTFVKLNKLYQATRLDIVGDGPLRQSLEFLAESLNGREIFFHGHVSDGISKYFHEADVFVLPGLGGLAISDALTHSVPVICTIGDGCEGDLIRNNGRIIENMTEEALLEQLTQLIEEPELLQHWKNNTYKIIEEKFNISSYVESIDKAIRSVQ